jgi:3-deoxy-D-manno-octulosonic-acid transferase
MVVNGRITQKSLESYGRFRPLFHEMVQRVDCWAMQAQEDAQRIKLLGANPLKVLVAGNTKYDAAAAQPVGKPDALKAKLGWGPRRRVLVAGSTRPGEEAGILAAYAALRAGSQEWALLLAPRHLERLDEVLGLARASGLAWRRRSAELGGPQADVVVLDTLGELAGFYACAELALVGGSFADWGGQNPLEPAALGLPLVFGPSMRHFRDIAADLLAAGAARQVPLAALPVELPALARQAKLLKGMGQAGRELVAAKAGAARRNAEMALKLYTIDRFQNRERHWREDAAYPAQKPQEFGAAFDRRDV